jgi:hypothetical protein
MLDQTQTKLTGTLKASELIAKLEEGYVLERLPTWSHGSEEEDRKNSAGFYRVPAKEENGWKIEAWHDSFGCGSAWMRDVDQVFAEIIRTPQRYHCYDRIPKDYPNQFDLSITAENNPKKDS